MQSNLICPFFNTTKDKCEVGKDFISFNESKNIIDICICNYHSCKRYKTLKNKKPYLTDFLKNFILNNKYNIGREK